MHNYVTQIVNMTLKNAANKAGFTLPRFFIVSVVGYAIGTIVLWVFTDKIGLFYIFSGIIGAISSIMGDFILHQIWTFGYLPKERYFKEILKRFGKFAASKSLGFLIALILLAFFTQIVGIHYLISNIFAVLGSFIFNYTMSSKWVWANQLSTKENQLLK